jgi:hypothetical protein
MLLHKPYTVTNLHISFEMRHLDVSCFHVTYSSEIIGLFYVNLAGTLYFLFY